MNTLAKTAIGIIALGGCQVTTIEIESVFDPNEVAFAWQEGGNTVSGQGFLRQRGGGVVTCAGEEVFLIPSSKYSRERMTALYGSASKPGANYNQNVQLSEEDPLMFLASMRTATCNTGGDFEFSGIPDGHWFVETRVVWDVVDHCYGGYCSTSPQGGTIMSPVAVAGGESKQIFVGW